MGKYKKSDLLDIVAKDIQSDPLSLFDVKLLDGAAIVHLLPNPNVTLFDE